MHLGSGEDVTISGTLIQISLTVRTAGHLILIKFSVGQMISSGFLLYSA